MKNKILVSIILTFLSINSINIFAEEMSENKNEKYKSDVDIQIEKSRQFHTKSTFLDYIKENVDSTNSFVDYGEKVWKIQDELNKNSNTYDELNNYVEKVNNKLTFQHIKENENHEIYNNIIPFALEIHENSNKYNDYFNIIRNGKVGVNSVSILGELTSSKITEKPVNKIIEKGTKEYIKIKEPNKYSVKNVKSILKKLGLNVQIKIAKKPKTFKMINHVPTHKEYVSKIWVEDSTKIKQGDKVIVTFDWKENKKSKDEAKILKKQKKEITEKLKKIKSLTSVQINIYKKEINNKNDTDELDIIDDEFDTLINKEKEKKKLEEKEKKEKEANEAKEKEQKELLKKEDNANINNNTTIDNENSTDIVDKPKISSGSFTSPLSDMHISQGLHDGLAIDYQPSGCFQHPGCVPAYAVMGGIAHVQTHSMYGNEVIVEHPNGMCTRYAHLNSFSVGDGASVSSGQSVGRVGTSGNSTGVHLHFEVRNGGSGCYGSMINPHSLGL